jgi:hypothetical protein
MTVLATRRQGKREPGRNFIGANKKSNGGWWSTMECGNEACREERRFDPTLECDGSGDEETHCTTCSLLFRKECPECGSYWEVTECPRCTKEPVICTHEFN